jgi:2-polyprenyl-3-methyl-5-hydroxy-6-metoxy-1,4-benzoquinol methylase
MSSKRFYAEEVYEQGFTTRLPSRDELSEMLATHFAGTEKDFTARIDVIRSAGLAPGARILDFGGSWGYGSWQLRQAGFQALTYEIGQDRARYAREHLSCTMVEDLRSLDGTIDCFFSSHVIEHLPDPSILLDEASRLLRPGGIFVCYCPNGAADYERAETRTYHLQWGMVHPLMVTPSFMKKELQERGFVSCNVFSTPIEAKAVGAGHDGRLDGAELLTVARRAQKDPTS